MMRTASLYAAAAALAVAYLSGPARADMNVDPAGSPLWPTAQQEVSGTARTTFDSRIRIAGPVFAEDAIQVPIAFDASALSKVECIVIVVGRNPIRKVLRFAPIYVHLALLFRFKLQETPAVRAAARTPDGIRHIGALQVGATGGGCTLPSATRQNATWSTTLDQVESRVFPNFNSVGSRIRLRVMHPMDTGLVADIPSFHIEQLNLLDTRRQPMLELALYEPVAENPILSFDLDDPVGRDISMAGVDNSDNRIRAQVTRWADVTNSWAFCCVL